MSEPVLQVHDLSIAIRSRGITVEVVSDLSFAIQTGEILGMVGESGSGKTVTALAVMGLLKPPLTRSSGGIRLLGVDLTQLPERELNRFRGASMSMIFQEPLSALNPLLPVGEQIREVVSAHRRISRRQARRQALEIMDRVGLPQVETVYRQYPHQLSGGMRQRALIAAALICRPQLLIADEPTTALDVTIQAEILKLLRRLTDELGFAVLYITHDLAVVAELCDRVLTLYAGEQIEEGGAEQVLEHPLHPYTEGLLQSLPLLQQESPAEGIPGSVPQPGEMPSGCRFHPRCRYVTETCCLERQVLATTPEGRRVRCRRWDEIELKGLKLSVLTPKN